MKNFLTRSFLLLLASVIGLILSTSTFGQATIVIDNVDTAGVGFNDTTPAAPVGGNNGTTLGDQRLNAFQAAANIWGATIVSGVNIHIRANWASQPCTATAGTLGSAGATSLRANFANAPVANTWFAVAEANSLANTDLNGPSAEIQATFNIDVGKPTCLPNGWYYGLDNNHGSKIDLVTVLLHEFGHGLGFASFTDETNGQQAGSGAGLPGIFDRFLFDRSTGKTWDQMTNAERQASAINSGNLVWNGPQVMTDASSLSAGKDPQGRPLMWAPNPVDAGSSVSHWDKLEFPNQLMEPTITNLTHNVTAPTDLTFSLLRDIGWCAGCTPPPPAPTPTPPANNNFVDGFVLNGCSGSTTGTNNGANKEAGEPSHDPMGNAGGGSVWWQWTPNVSSSVTITTIGSDYDTLLAVYTGNTVSGLSACPTCKNDDIDTNGGNLASSVTFNAVAGTTYRIAVDGWGGDTGNIVLNWNSATCNPPIGGMQFGVPNYGVNESQFFVTINVTRTDTSGAASVNYATSDTAGLQNCTVINGRASERCDYVTAAGTLNFAAGEATRTFTVSMINDVHVEGPETFTVALSNPVGGSLGSQTTATVTIVDNDTTTATQNPIDGVEFFIRQMYRDILNRQPDSTGLQNWIDTLAPCPNGGFGEPPTSDCDRLHVAAGFFQSDEFLNRGYWAFRFYMVSFNQRPTYAQFIPDMAQVGGPKSPAEEEASKVVFADAFVQRTAFTQKYPGLHGQALANALVATSGLPSYTVQGGETDGQILRHIAERQSSLDKFLTEGTVSILYFGFQRRDPDTVGYQNNLDTLNASPNNLRHMIFIFIYSTEYRQRFGPP